MARERLVPGILNAQGNAGGAEGLLSAQRSSVACMLGWGQGVGLWAIS